MEIEDSFLVALPLDEAWRILMDIERIAPCLPGAQLQEVAGDEYRGVVKVKVGPITAQYKGVARLESVDDAAHTAVIVGNGRDTRGQGNASATIRLAATPEGDGTRVTVETDLSITGKVAQFGRGVLADVSTKLLGQFVENLERDVLSEPAATVDLTVLEGEAAGGSSGVAPPDVDPAAAAGAVAAVTEPAASPSGNGAAVRRIDHREAEPVDLMQVGGAPLLRRLAPLLALGGLVLGLGILLRRRRRS